MSEKRKCDHEIDWKSAGIPNWSDETCDVGVHCTKCGAVGYAPVEASMVIWEDEDD